MKKFWHVLAVIFSLVILIGGIILWFLGPVSLESVSKVFVVPQELTDFDLPQKLYEQGFIRSASSFKLLVEYMAIGKSINPGGYRLNKNMFAWQVIEKITSSPDLLWVKTSSCLRREQIGEFLAEKLGWGTDKLQQWDNAYKVMEPEYLEGVYFPDTYLLPKDETPLQIARRYINNFNEKFAPLSSAFGEKNIRWTTGLKIASLIQREAAGPADMPLISGIIWNRLDRNMPLQIDATMQYTLGKQPDGSWWGVIDLMQKHNDSPYNSYLYKGLPPTPICSPGFDAIKAVINPAETDCLYYLHDHNREIHCATTYQDHLENINKYLNN